MIGTMATIRAGNVGEVLLLKRPGEAQRHTDAAFHVRRAVGVLDAGGIGRGRSEDLDAGLSERFQPREVSARSRGHDADADPAAPAAMPP